MLGGIDSGLCIILKASLQWVPVLGPVSLRAGSRDPPKDAFPTPALTRAIAPPPAQAMQFFGFVFIDKRKTLQKSNVVNVAAQALEDGTPSALLIFPEGTLFSRLTRPKSDAFASTSGVVSLRVSLKSRID